MTNTPKRILALLAALFMLAGSLSFAAGEEAEAPEGILAVINGREVPLTDAQIEFSYYAALYEAYGLADQIPTLQGEIADYYVKYYVMLDEAGKLGLDTFDEEELAGFAAEAQEAYDSLLAQYVEYFTLDGMTAEEIEAHTAEFLAENGYTAESIERSIRESALIERFYAHAAEGVAVTDETIQALYEEQVAAQQAGYEADASQFEYDVMYGNDIYYVPEGFRSVYHILLLLDEDAQETLYELQTRQAEIKEELEADGADAGALNAENEAIEAEIDALCADLMARVLEIRDRIDAGEDFMALMEEYGEDPGMKNEPYMSKGYYVSADSAMWEPNFRDAAMALKNVGDVSDPVLTGYGIHLILYSAALTPGAVPLEEVREGLEAGALETLEEKAIEEAVQAAVDAAEIACWPDRLTYESAAASEEAVG
ncbi:MAG: peptidylprolyl isomerase [Clostridia bacterium]|nr:peptidylprolyl isomerase [Clostridia bacterium]